MFWFIVPHLGFCLVYLQPQGGALSNLEVVHMAMAVSGWALAGKMVCWRRLGALRARYAHEKRLHRQIAIALFTLMAWPYFWVILPPEGGR